MLNLENLQLINTNSPRETLAYKGNGVVYKIPVKRTNPAYAKVWLDKQKLSKQVADSVSAKKTSDTYTIPKILEISDKEFFVKEELVTGEALKSSFVETLTPEELDIIYKGLANFTNDINQSRSVLTQKDSFDISTNINYVGGTPMSDVLEGLKKYLPEKSLDIVRMAKDWFDTAAENDASVVFAHGDINEHNVLFDRKTKKLSILDFAEAKYQNANYMFYVDYARLGWLDIDRLVEEYEKLPKAQPVRTKTDIKVKDMRNALYNFKSTAEEFLKKPNIATKIRLGLISQYIDKIKQLYEKVTGFNDFEKGLTNINTLNQIKEKQNNEKKAAAKKKGKRK